MLSNSPIRVSRHAKRAAIRLNKQGVTEDVAASTYGMSRSTLQRAKRRQEQYGHIEGGQKKRGRKSLLSPGMEDITSHNDRSDCRFFF
jgi:transposase